MLTMQQISFQYYSDFFQFCDILKGPKIVDFYIDLFHIFFLLGNGTEI